MSRSAIRDIKIIEDDPFDYSVLPDRDAERLRDAAAYINTRLSLTYDLMVEIGTKLLEIKTDYEGSFMDWSTKELKVGYDTVRNYMNVAQNFPNLTSGQADNISDGAKYKLGQPSTSQEARDEAAALALKGQQVDYQTAFILANAPPSVRQLYDERNLTKGQAYELARVYSSRGMPEEVKNLCLEEQVRDAEVVRFVWKAWQKNQSDPSRVYPMILEDRGFNMMGRFVPLNAAQQSDTMLFIDHMQKRIGSENAAEKWDWKRMKRPVAVIDGEVYVKVGKMSGFNDGDEVYIDLRIPRGAK